MGKWKYIEDRREKEEGKGRISFDKRMEKRKLEKYMLRKFKLYKRLVEKKREKVRQDNW